MSEQTANLCTTDAAESLRAVVAERDREIERLNSDYNEACEDAMCVAREIERQKMKCLNLLQQLEDLKAQSSGVVDAQRLLDWNRSQPEPRPIVVGREYQVAEACARLNQPVSACGVDERAAFETWYETTYGISLEPEFRANHFIGYVNDKANHRWTAWQARAALSAPSHGEQVRHMVPAWMASARTFVDRLHLAGWRDHADAQHAGVAGMYDELLAATPSAGSQEQGE